MYSKKVLIQSEPFCVTGIVQLHAYFTEYMYGYVFFACFFIGITLNLLNIVVFTRKTMHSSNNLILANLATVDMFAIIAYTPRAWHEYIRVQSNSVREHRVYDWEMVSLHSWYMFVIFHGVSIWLTMMLTVWRYIAVAHPLKERHWCDMRTTRNWIIAGYAAPVLVLVPTYFGLYVGSWVTLLDDDGNITTNTTIGVPTTIAIMRHTKMSEFVRSVRIAVHGLILKIVPCIVATVFSYKLIIALIRAKKQRAMLTASATIYQSQTTIVKTKQSTDRTTKIILVVVFLFLIQEIPHSICCLYTAVYGSKFFLGCYSFLMEMLNNLIFICTSINFLVYYIMSQQFRNTFKNLFHCAIFSSRKSRIIYPDGYTCYDTSARSSVTTLQSSRTPSITTISSSHNNNF